MNVLLIGVGRMTDELIDRLSKSGHRVYLLTGQRGKAAVHKRVFEKFDFAYEDESVKDIFDSVRPDVTIFTGACDENFDWRRAQQEMVRYTAAAINIMAAYSLVGSGRLIYLSSQAVYGGSYQDNIGEAQRTEPRGFKAMALAQGEEICTNYRSAQGLKAVVLRLDNLYFVPGKGQTTEGPCFAMCLEALRDGRISASDRDVFSMLFIKDAVELVYKAVAAEDLPHPVYHISSMEEVNGMQLAQVVSEAMGGVQIVDDSIGEYHRVVLDGNLFQQELGQRILTGWQQGAEQVAEFMRRNSDSFIYAEDAGGGGASRMLHTIKRIGKSLLPFVENLAVFLIAFFVGSLPFSQEFFARLDFYLLYVLLFAVFYGQRQAVFSGLLSVIGYCIQQMYTRSGFEVLLDYNTYVWMAQLFIVGMVVGYLKDQLQTVKQEDRDEIQYLEGKLRDITEINESNMRMKENFEVQLVNQRDSLGKIYEITSELESQAPEEVLFHAARVLSRMMDCRDVAVYTVANGDYARLFSSTSPEARRLGASIKYTDMASLYGALKERRVYINRGMEEKLPQMACAVYDGEGMQLIFMLWGIPWQRMTLAEANRLAIAGQLAQSAVLRANRYLDALRSSRYVGDSNLLAKDAFAQLIRAFFAARDQGLTECTLLEVLTGAEDPKTAAGKLGRCIRQSDYMGILENGKLYALLCNTGEENAGFVIERFGAAGYGSLVEKGAAL